MTLQTLLLLVHLNMKYPLTARPIRLQRDQTANLSPVESRRVPTQPLR